MLSSLYYSFTDYNLIQVPTWVGIQNYREMADDHLFKISLKNSFLMTIMAVPLTTLLCLSLALLLNHQIRLRSFFRSIFFLPSVVPMVAAAVCWMWYLNPQYGPLNKFLALLGIDGPNWLRDVHWAKPALVMTILWVSGPTTVIYLAALQSVPSHLLESAELDGAGWFRRFWHVTLPAISPAILFNVIAGLIDSFQIFTQPYIMTVNPQNPLPGGPANATLVYAINLYNNAFKYFKMGYASALAWVMFVIIFICTALVFFTSARWVYYESEGGEG
ncbi:MAG: sugar ABC transporter permease [Firmicutes bacterium]|nr:sugar ABC transporter permease [Bacillota bacterium]